MNILFFNRARHVCVYVFAMAGLSAPNVYAETSRTSCLLTCAGPEGCEVMGDAMGSSSGVLSRSTFRRFERCEQLTVVSEGAVQMRYRHKRKWFEPPPQTKNQRLRDVFANYPADPCGVPSPACLQIRMSSKVAARAGHGVDGQAAVPAGTGEPCSIGLPCGLVLPPSAQWAFRLEDASLDGVWVVDIKRGDPPVGVPTEFSSPVVGGEVRAEGNRFTPGAVYAYRLMARDGKVLASGEFEVMGASRLAQVQRLAESRATKSGLSGEAAWIDALAAFDLDWDANQHLLVR